MSAIETVPEVENYKKLLNNIINQINQICKNINRDPSTIKIVGVSKYVDHTKLPYLLDAGIHVLAENRWQIAKPKLESERSHEVEWHFIGRLQTNKINFIVPRFSWIHSVDSVERLINISQSAERALCTVNCLLQVNISGELTKSGVSRGQVMDLAKLALTLPGINFRGLMTMAPHEDNSENTRTVFRGLKQLLDDIQYETGVKQIDQLSMGMSNDYQLAIEEGATIVRIGRKLCANF